jgi:hypothetical protein
MRPIPPLLAALALLAPAAVAAQEAPAPACPRMDAELPADLAGWTDRAPAAQGATLVPGRAVDAALRPTAEVAYSVAPEKPGAPGTYGGVFPVRIETAGAYRVVLGGRAWIDLLEDGRPAASTGHGHGPGCTSAVKIVAFRLQPGDHVLQVSGAPGAALPVMVVPGGLVR